MPGSAIGLRIENMRLTAILESERQIAQSQHIRFRSLHGLRDERTIEADRRHQRLRRALDPNELAEMPT